MIAAMLIFKGLKNLHLGMSNVNSFLTIFMIGAAIWMGTFVFAKSLKRKDLDKSTFQMFSWMQVFTACGFAFSHGANDIANAIGPVCRDYGCAAYQQHYFSKRRAANCHVDFRYRFDRRLMVCR